MAEVISTYIPPSFYEVSSFLQMNITVYILWEAINEMGIYVAKRGKNFQLD
jgi:hypothetical protein